MTIALAALQLLAALPAHGSTAAGRRASMTQGGGKKAVRRRAPDTLLPGVWGGRHARLEVTEGGVRVEFDCAHATVEGRVVVDRAGRFSVAGTYKEEHGGPIRAGEASAGGYPVRLSGRVGGSLMKLTVTRAGTRRLLGAFTLARDREAELVKCR